HDRIQGMVQNRPDWCISRQRLWGVPITVLYCEACAHQITTPEFFERVVAAFREEGADAWFEREPKDLLPEGFTCPKCGGVEFRKEFDILDVWFDSGSSHLAVLAQRPELSWPCAVYMEGHDQHRGWFQSSLLIGTGVEGAAPFERVVTCGFVVDDKGRKMSKSLGNVVAPQEVIQQHGADILRLWVAMIDYRDDMAISREILSRIADAFRKIRNTARFLIMNLDDFEPSTDAVAEGDLEPLDRWILHRAHTTFQRARQAYEEFEFHGVYHRVLDFCTVDVSALYLDIAKDRLYVEASDSRSRRSAQTALYRIAEGLASVVAPILAFTAEEIYEHLPGAREASVHLTSFPEASVELDRATMESWTRLFTLREAVTRVLEKHRAAGEIGHSLEADIELVGNFALETLLGGIRTDLAKLFIVSHVEIVPASSETSGLERIELAGIGAIGVRVKPARGNKCGRCWHYREEVGAEGELCARCQSIVAGQGPA
ncbi:MAG TPA: class I tRNA ligase family protein, partial [Thermoanaerobaculia bacterium]|nr:class I tRNA ligase family protein [Thermoanaerobaculia bacterium]